MNNVEDNLKLDKSIPLYAGFSPKFSEHYELSSSFNNGFTYFIDVGLMLKLGGSG